MSFVNYKTRAKKRGFSEHYLCHVDADDLSIATFLDGFDTANKKPSLRRPVSCNSRFCCWRSRYPRNLSMGVSSSLLKLRTSAAAVSSRFVRVMEGGNNEPVVSDELR